MNDIDRHRRSPMLFTEKLNLKRPAGRRRQPAPPGRAVLGATSATCDAGRHRDAVPRRRHDRERVPPGRARQPHHGPVARPAPTATRSPPTRSTRRVSRRRGGARRDARRRRRVLRPYLAHQSAPNPRDREARAAVQLPARRRGPHSARPRCAALSALQVLKSPNEGVRPPSDVRLARSRSPTTDVDGSRSAGDGFRVLDAARTTDKADRVAAATCRTSCSGRPDPAATSTRCSTSPRAVRQRRRASRGPVTGSCPETARGSGPRTIRERMATGNALRRALLGCRRSELDDVGSHDLQAGAASATRHRGTRTRPTGTRLRHRAVGRWTPLDDADIDNGCMWFVPGSHPATCSRHRHLGDDPAVHILVVDDRSTRRRAVPVPLKAGGAAFHHPPGLLHHAAPNTTERGPAGLRQRVPDRADPSRGARRPAVGHGRQGGPLVERSSGRAGAEPLVDLASTRRSSTRRSTPGRSRSRTRPARGAPAAPRTAAARARRTGASSRASGSCSPTSRARARSATSG